MPEPEQIKPVGYGSPPVRTQFRPGQSGNPGGRLRSKPFTDRLRALLEEAASNEADDDESGEPTPPRRKNKGDMFVESMLRAAIDGDVGAGRMLWDRLEGRAAESRPDDDEAAALDPTAEDMSEGSKRLKAWQDQQRQALPSNMPCAPPTPPTSSTTTG